MTTSTNPVLVTGGTGTLGRQLVPRLRAAGRDVRVLSRQPRGAEPGIDYVAADLSEADDATAVARAVSGIGTIIHAAGSTKGDATKTKHLIDAIHAAQARPHLVYISVVGADRTPVVSRIDRAMFGYVEQKRLSEELIADSGLPWTTLRATQFHDLALLTAQAMARLPVVPVPAGTSMQPVETAEVAERLVELALGEPQGLVADLGGPRVYGMDELIGSYLAAIGKSRPIVRMRMPGKAARAFREGVNLAPERAVGRRTWEDFLAGHVGALSEAAA
jgi:uncharacterized protein YbjT (DUF2867 family)